MLHICHIFLYPSLSDSDLSFDTPLNAQIPARFQRKAYEPRVKIAARRAEPKTWPAILPRFINNLASSVFIKHKARKFSSFDNHLWPATCIAVCIEGITTLNSHQKFGANTGVYLKTKREFSKKKSY